MIAVGSSPHLHTILESKSFPVTATCVPPFTSPRVGVDDVNVGVVRYDIVIVFVDNDVSSARICNITSPATCAGVIHVTVVVSIRVAVTSIPSITHLGLTDVESTIDASLIVIRSEPDVRTGMDVAWMGVRKERRMRQYRKIIFCCLKNVITET